MIVRVWRTRVEQDRAAEYERFAREVSYPMFRSQPGYAGVLMGREGDDCVVVTLWKTRADAEALAASSAYLATVERIVAQGFLRGEQSTVAFDAHLADLPGGV
ncbi:antibiotic biosynthesis monooxygenase family protein [Motilibacter aurantiacus]|uniref:antibiotic biosynthesis monooxygenase family protein n=1 Tax=Motilibacter aurantiacus TaxID=2714955 RepID=UPI00140A6758|nr:antibiotic biosynthesis monooxygenase [Motilibacter aurantiacus]NHC44385.1 hypothetical protein [Motilibacter aurantiacus]